MHFRAGLAAGFVAAAYALPQATQIGDGQVQVPTYAPAPAPAPVSQVCQVHNVLHELLLTRL